MINIPQTSDFVENRLKARPSGAVHLMGNLAPAWAVYVSSLIRRARPKSATFTKWFFPTKQFLAAKSLQQTASQQQRHSEHFSLLEHAAITRKRKLIPKNTDGTKLVQWLPSIQHLWGTVLQGERAMIAKSITLTLTLTNTLTSQFKLLQTWHNTPVWSSIIST